jgi:WD40 repeat protein
MRWPRVRFTIRLLMLSVAIIAAVVAEGVRHLKPGRARDLTIPGARAVLDGAEEEIRSLTFSASGETLGAVGRLGSVQLWDAGTVWPQASLPPHGHFAYALSISPDGRSVSIADSAGDEPNPVSGLSGSCGSITGRSACRTWARSPSGRRPAIRGSTGERPLPSPPTAD